MLLLDIILISVSSSGNIFYEQILEPSQILSLKIFDFMSLGMVFCFRSSSTNNLVLINSIPVASQ